MELHIAFLQLFSPLTFMIIGFFGFLFSGEIEEYDKKIWILPIAWFMGTFLGTLSSRRVLYLFNFPAVLFAGYGFTLTYREVLRPYVDEGLQGLLESDNCDEDSD